LVPVMRWHVRLVPVVYRFADGLADEVGTDRVALQFVRVQQVAFAPAVAVVGLLDLEMIAPARQLDPVIAELLGFASHLLQRQIGPLTREERNRTWHVRTFRNSERRNNDGYSRRRESLLWRVGRAGATVRAFDPRSGAIAVTKT